MVNMDINRNSFIKVLVVVIIITGLSAGCGSTPEKSDLLREARNAIAQAEANPNAANSEALTEAKEALNKAEMSNDAEITEHFAHMAKQQAQLALEVAQRQALEDQRESLAQDVQEEQGAQDAQTLAEEQAQRERLAEEQARRERLAEEQAQRERLTQPTEPVVETPPPARHQPARKNRQLQKKLAQWQKSKTGRLVVTLDDGFETGKTDLAPQTLRDIETLAVFLNRNRQLKASVEGHTDNVGNPQHNLGLSERRATSVKFALMERGLTSKRILVKGFGGTKPIASNRTERGRQKNRRVDVVIFNEYETLPVSE
jgi:OOP family OmpA-OmpF porin